MVTPVIFFAYNRPQQTLRVLEALSRQSVRPAEVLAFSDGPARPGDEAGVREVRELLRNYRDLPITLTERPTNLGSAGNIVSGLNEIFERYPQAVVIEDDVLPSEVFYEAMERLLDVYRNEPRIFSVGGYPTTHPDALPEYPFDVILSPRFSCWGWAIWADRWQTVGAQVLQYRPALEAPDKIARQAGDDVVQAVRAVNKYPGRYWDYPILLESLQQNWLHALTKTYLTNNIGFDGGVNYRPNQRFIKFITKTNPLSLKIPSRFPEIELRPDVTAATRQYVAARDRAKSPSWIDKTYASTLRILSWWHGSRKYP